MRMPLWRRRGRREEQEHRGAGRSRWQSSLHVRLVLFEKIETSTGVGVQSGNSRGWVWA